MLHAAVRQSPVFGGAAANVSALSVEGTGALAVVDLSGAVAVVAESWWLAQRVLDGLAIEWEAPPEMEALDTDAVRAALEADLEAEGWIADEEGDVEAALAASEVVIEADYEVPLLSHAPLEPMNCVAWARADRCEIWAPTQYALGVARAARQLTGLPEAAIDVHTMPIGGGFGRKAEVDFAAQAVALSVATGRPVKVIWSRAEDTQHDYFRPPMAIRIRAGLADGRITGWAAASAGCAIYSERSEWNVWGLVDTPYDLGARRVTYTATDLGLPIGWMRGVGFSKCLPAIEGVMDELADAAGVDPLAFRRAHLGGDARAAGVLDALEAAASWGAPAAHGASQGLCLMKHYGRTYVAAAAEVTVDGDRVTVHRVTVAVDVGTVVNPTILAAQIEGGVVFGVSTGLLGEITLTGGRVDQSNFHDYALLPMSRSPHVEVVIVESGEPPGGIGEYGVAVAPAAILNAIARATGRRVRRLPITREGFTLA